MRGVVLVVDLVVVCIVWFGCCLRLVWWWRCCGLVLVFGFSGCVGWFGFVWFYDVGVPMVVVWLAFVSWFVLRWEVGFIYGGLLVFDGMFGS